MYDIVIIGAGTAGLSAAIYGVRAGKTVLVLEGENYGGQIINSPEVENYPGIAKISGFEFATGLYEQAQNLGAVIEFEAVTRVERDGKDFVVYTDEREIPCHSVILATGAKNRPLGVDKEEALVGAGVSYCATCDGAFFRNKVTAVIGGGDVAVEDAIFLARMCSKVYLIHRRNELRAAKSLQESLFAQENVEILWDTVADSIEGEGSVECLKITNVKTGEKSELALQGVFIAVGISPESRAFEGLVDMDHGYIKAGEDGVTSVPGIFAAGDVRTKLLRQIVTAAADGANAVTSAERYLTAH